MIICIARELGLEQNVVDWLPNLLNLLTKIKHKYIRLLDARLSWVIPCLLTIDINLGVQLKMVHGWLKAM